MGSADYDDRPFSMRHGFVAPEREIRIREDAPESLRSRLLSILYEAAGILPSNLRSIVCHVLCVRRDPNNWSEYPNIHDEVEKRFFECEWYKVYDIVEAISAYLQAHQPDRSEEYERAVNKAFIEMGVGWQLVGGRLFTRGEEAQETVLQRARQELDAARMPTAREELTEATRDLSRRPDPDLSGAMHHAMSAMECVARELSGDPSATLGDILKKHPRLLPRPLDEAVSKVWGYASENARHGREGRVLRREEAELVVGLSATAINYLLSRRSAPPQE